MNHFAPQRDCSETIELGDILYFFICYYGEADDSAQKYNCPFVQSLKLGLFALAWAESTVSAMGAGELRGPSRPLL